VLNARLTFLLKNNPAGEICILLGYYATSSFNPLPMFRDNVSIQPFKGQDFLILEDGTDMLSRNVGKQLPSDAAYYPRRAQILSTSRQKHKISNAGGAQNETDEDGTKIIL
jgi:hypothetical protein